MPAIPDVIVHVGNERARNASHGRIIVAMDHCEHPAVHDLAGQSGVRAVHARIHITYHRAGRHLERQSAGSEGASNSQGWGTDYDINQGIR